MSARNRHHPHAPSSAGRPTVSVARRQAFALYATGKLTQALEQAMTVARPDADLLNLAATCHTRLGQPSQAEAAYRQALRLQPNHADVHYNLGNLLQNQNRLAEAETAYRQALDTRPDHANTQFNLGVLLQGLHRATEAEAIYRQLLHLQPHHIDGCFNLGTLLQAQKRSPEAEAAYRQVILLQPDHLPAHFNLGNLLQGAHRADEAEIVYRQLLHLQPDHAHAQINLGNLLQGQHRPIEAEAAYRHALRLQPDLADAHLNLGIVLREQKAYAAAEAAYRQVILLQPQYVKAYLNLGNLLQDRQRLPEAEAAYRHAILLQPDLADAHFNLGYILRKQGRLAEAMPCYRHALAMDPTDPFGAQLSLAALGYAPLPRRASEARLDKIYAERADHWDQDAHYHGAALVAAALRGENGQTGLDILDAGCGTGMVGVLLRDLAKRLDGIDLSADMLKKARAKGVYDQVEQGDLESFMVNHPQQYDAIACAATLIHFGHLSSVFLAAARALRANGRFVFTLFSHEVEPGGEEVVVNPMEGLEHGGCYAHGQAYIVRTAEAAGFVVETLQQAIHEADATPVLCFVVVLRLRPV
ncbi:MAG: tetratricopeptide repeat protein [Magnetococcales bacterium]|nr:tetratricopeptide repeat protein [Magnetococcales bacterium]